jgi:hypothetical protein
MASVLEVLPHLKWCEECGEERIDGRVADVCPPCAGEEDDVCEHEDWDVEEVETYVYGASVETGPYRTEERAVCLACGAVATGWELDEEMDDDGYVLRTRYPVWD